MSNKINMMDDANGGLQYGWQSAVSRAVGISRCHFSLILSAKRRPSWRIACRLAEMTGTTVALWMEGAPKQIPAGVGDGLRRLEKRRLEGDLNPWGAKSDGFSLLREQRKDIA
ncbi:hypothetical protein ACFL0Q_00155 [Thermodesulfobacteriota bacterium]